MWIQLTLETDEQGKQEYVERLEQMGVRGAVPKDTVHIWVNLAQAITIWIGDNFAVVTLANGESAKTYAPEEIAKIKSYLAA